MRVILLKDIEDLGKKNEIKEVKDGYARNFLLPKGFAKIADKRSMEQLESQKELESQKAEEELKKTQALIEAIEGRAFVINVKTGDEGQLFESVSVGKLYEALKEQGFEVKKTQIEMVQPIKELGEFPVKLKFDHNLEAEVTIIIEEEKK
ncbi:MAG: 50S ribosomal protein L9 [Patescibacteria group bacterium]|nr:50S ribosomal protein L9 [Patescibacteria group bacterium]